MTVNIKRYWVIPSCNHPQLHCGREGGGVQNEMKAKQNILKNLKQSDTQCS